MRTGKTRVIVEQVARLDDVTGLLVVAPNGVHAQWVEREIPKWTSIPTCRMVWRSASTHPEEGEALLKFPGLQVLALNIESLQIERVQNLVRRFLAAHRDGQGVMIVFDESHAFRRPGARRTRLARGLAKKCAYRRILSGTPALNSPLHLWSQFELLEPCALGHRTFASFKSHHAEYRQQTRRDGRSYPQLVGYHNLEELRDWVSLWATVVPRSQADVPDVLQTERVVPLSPPQRRAYDDLKRDVLRVAAEGAGDIEVKAHLLKLQQVLGGFVYDDEGQTHSIDDNPPRLVALVEEVLGTDPCKAIVWCRFSEDIRRCVGALSKVGVEVVEYHGGVKYIDREQAIARFHFAPGPIAFVGQPQAAGQGLDLSPAAAVIWYSHVHDAIVREQASARASMKGGDPVVLVDLVAERTLDTGILEMLHDKRSLSEELVGEGLAAMLAGITNAGKIGVADNEFAEYDSQESTGRHELPNTQSQQGGNTMAQRKSKTSKAKTSKAKGDTATKAAKAPKGPTINDTARAAIKAGQTNAEVLATVQGVHPKAKTTMASVAWYRNDMRKAGEKIKTSREISAARRAAEAKAASKTAKKS